MPDENKDQLSQAIVAAADREYSKFKDAIDGIVQDRFVATIQKAAADKAATLFSKDEVVDVEPPIVDPPSDPPQGE